jgi:hypothetical protein
VRRVSGSRRPPGSKRGCCIENGIDGFWRDAGTIVGHDDAGLSDGDVDDRRDAGFFGGIERVIDQLFEDDEGPILDGVPGLVDEFLLRTEFG